MKFKGVESVKLALVVGRAEVEGWDGDCVEVSYNLHGDDVRVETEVEDGTLLIAEKPRRKFFNRLGKGNWAEIRVRVPKGTIVNVNNVNGTVEGRDARFKEIKTVSGKVDLRNCEVRQMKCVNGHIRATLPVAGPLNASTVNGALEITIEDIEGEVNVSSVNGNVFLRLTEFCDARIEVKKANGCVELVGVDPENPVIGTGEFPIRVKTVNGYVRVELI